MIHYTNSLGIIFKYMVKREILSNFLECNDFLVSASNKFLAISCIADVDSSFFCFIADVYRHVSGIDLGFCR